MGIRFGKGLWRRAALVVGVGLPCALYLEMREAASWRPQLLPGTANAEHIAFSPVAPLLASSHLIDQNTTSRIQIWDIQQKKVLWSHKNGWGFGRLAFSPDGKILASLTTDITLWDVQTGEVVRTMANKDSNEDSEPRLQFSPDGKKLFVMGRQVGVYDVGTGRFLGYQLTTTFYEFSRFRVLHSAPKVGKYRVAEDFSFAPDGKTMVMAVGELEAKLQASPEQPHQIAPVYRVVYGLGPQLWLDRGPDHEKTFLTGAGAIAAYSADSRWLVTYPCGNRAMWEGAKVGMPGSPTVWDCNQLQLWDLTSRKMVRPFDFASGRTLMSVSNVVFSPDGTRLYASLNNPNGGASVLVWEVATGRLVRRIEPHSSADYEIAVSADNSLLAFKSDGETNNVMVWRVR